MVDLSLRTAVQEVAGPLTGALLRIVGAGGKKLRPALTFAAAAIGDCSTSDPDVLAAATAVELLHCATLVHDDLIDVATTRRGVITLNSLEGMPTAIVGGDLLISAAVLAAGRVSARAGVVIAETLGLLCRGEAAQEKLRWDPDAPLDDIISVAGAKTGSLLRAACLLGCHSFQADPELCAAAADFGLDFGICLQLIDDLLDIVSSPASAGKPVGADFAAGTVTVPAALAMRSHPELRQLLRIDSDDASRRAALALLQDADEAIEATAALAREHADRASSRLLAAAPDQPAAERLARWPGEFLGSQLERVDGERHRRLIARSMAMAP